MNTSGTILVVDDDRAISALLHDCLSDAGYKVVTEHDPYLGLKRVRQNNIDLVITDLMMPGMSGIDVLKAIHKHDIDMPVVMITGYPTVDTAVKVMKEGATDFITKPFNLDHTRFVIKRAIEQGRLKKQNKILVKRIKEADSIKAVSRNLREKIRELTALYTISETLHHSLSTSELFGKVVEMARWITEAKKAGVWILDQEGEMILLKASRGMNNLTGLPIPLKDTGLVGKVFQEKEYALSQDYKDCICGEIQSGLRHPFLCFPLLIDNKIFGAIHICQKVGGANFTSDDFSLIKNLSEETSLRVENLALYENLVGNIMQSITSLVKAIDARDNYTMNHCRRVTFYALKVAQSLGCSNEMIDALRFAGPIHDVGKIGIRDEILLKPGILDLEEREIIKRHVQIGNDIVKPLDLGPLEIAIIRNHHERFDGKGYPDGLRFDKIPLVARIFAIADTYDAMTSTRPYRTARTHEEAIEELKRCSGTQFDGEVVNVFVRNGICKEMVEAA